MPCLDSTGAHSSEPMCIKFGVIEMTFVKTFIRDEAGASAAEYALILAVVGAGIALAAFNLGEAIDTSIGQATTTVTNCNATNAAAGNCK